MTRRTRGKRWRTRTRRLEGVEGPLWRRMEDTSGQDSRGKRRWTGCWKRAQELYNETLKRINHSSQDTKLYTKECCYNLRANNRDWNRWLGERSDDALNIEIAKCTGPSEDDGGSQERWYSKEHRNPAQAESSSQIRAHPRFSYFNRLGLGSNLPLARTDEIHVICTASARICYSPIL